MSGTSTSPKFFSHFSSWFKDIKISKSGYLTAIFAGLSVLVVSLLANYFFFTPEPESEPEITFKSVGNIQVCPELSSYFQDATFLIEDEKFSKAINTLVACQHSPNSHRLSKENNAVISGLLGYCHFNLDSLHTAEKCLLQSLGNEESEFFMRTLIRVYSKLHYQTKDKKYFDKYEEYEEKYEKLFSLIFFNEEKFNDISIFELNKNIDSHFEKPNLKLLSFGVDNFKDKKIRELNYCKRDVDIISTAFQESNLFGRIDKEILKDEKATKQQFFEKLKNLETKANDFAVIHVSTHGKASVSKNSDERKYIIPYDADSDDLLRTSINLNQIKKELKNKNVKLSLILLDACNDYTDYDSIASSYLKSFNKNEYSINSYENALKKLNAFITKPERGFNCIQSKQNFIQHLTYYNKLFKERKVQKNEIGNNDRKSNEKLFKTDSPKPSLDHCHYLQRISNINKDVNSNLIITIESSSLGEKSAESSEFNSSIFTHYLSEILSSPDFYDSNDNSKLEISEIAKYLQSSISEYSAKYGWNQNISVSID